MISYDRATRTLLHSTLRHWYGCPGTPTGSPGRHAGTQSRYEALVTCIGQIRCRGNRPPARRKCRLAGVAGIVIALAALIAPYRLATAQEGANPPISGAASTALFLPAVAHNVHAWFDDAELDAAMRRAGYDPVTAGMHTNCYLDPSSVLPYLVRYSSCEQYLIGDQPTEGSDHYIWYVRLGDGIVHGLEVGQ